MTGVCVKFLETFGFIRSNEDNKEYFVHFTDIKQKSGYRKLEEGQSVTFGLENNEKGFKCINVEVVR